MAKRVILVSEMYLSDYNRTSTHIMIDNIICGLVDNDFEILFIAIGNISEQDEILSKYTAMGIRVLFWRSIIPREITNKYKYLLSIYSATFKKFEIQESMWLSIVDFLDEDTILLSHSPSVESTYICKRIKKQKAIRYIQYWSDPISLGGILPEQFGIKRVPFWIIENRALSFADEIVYGTRTLMLFQKRLFKKRADKMRYIKVSYTPKDVTENIQSDEKLSILYSGNYFSCIRNIQPLYSAMKKLDSTYHLTIYGYGDINLVDTFNTDVHERIGTKEIQRIEMQADMQICILNQSCIQIPGKIFYNTDLKQRTLVLLDGKYKELIQKELEEYGCFEFCPNNEEAIVAYLKKYRDKNLSQRTDNSCDMLSPRNIVHDLVLNRS